MLIISKDTYSHALSGSLTEADRAKINLEAATLGNSTVGKLLSTFATNLAPIARDSLNASRSQGIDGSVQAAKGTARGQEIGLHAQLTNLRLNLGVTLLPTYVSLLSKANTVLERFNGFIKAHPRLTRMATVGIMATTGALAAAVPVLLIAGTALSAYGNLTAIAARRTAILEAAQLKNTAATIMSSNAEKAAGAVTLTRITAWFRPGKMLKGMFLGLLSPVKIFGLVAISTLRAVGLAFSFVLSPVGIVVAALIAGGILIWKYWEPIKAFMVGFGRGLTEAFAPARPVFAWLGGVIKPAIKWFHDFLVPVHETGQGLKAATDAGVRFGQMVGNGLKNVISIGTELVTTLSPIGFLGKEIYQHFGAIERLFGLGVKSPPPYTELPKFRQPAPAGATMGGDTHNHTYNITQQPGQSSEELARHIHRLSTQNSRPRPAFTDGPDGMMN